MVSHAFLTPPSAFDFESNDEQRLGGWCTGALRRNVLGHDGPGDLREWHRCFMPAFPEDPPQTKL